MKVILFNHSDQDFVIQKGDRIAQLILQEIPQVVLIQETELSETERGEGGFGSTGLKNVTNLENSTENLTDDKAIKKVNDENEIVLNENEQNGFDKDC